MTSGKRTKAERQGAGQRRPTAHMQAAARRRRRHTWAAVAAAIVVAGIGIGLGVSLASSGPHLELVPADSLGHLDTGGPPGPPGPEGVPVPSAPLLATTASEATGQPVAGISCSTSEQVAYHVHTHLTVFVDGNARQIPDGIGIVPPRTVQHTSRGPFVTGGSCFYWLHTHAADGIIHIESPTQRAYTLGDFFAIWGLPLGRDQVGPARGKVTAFYDGKAYSATRRTFPSTTMSRSSSTSADLSSLPKRSRSPQGCDPPSSPASGSA